MDEVDSFNSRFKSSILSSLLKDRSPRCKINTDFNDSFEKTKKYMFASKFLSLTQRIGIGSAPKMVPAEKIDHNTAEGRDIFFNQVCYLIQTKIPVSQYQK